MLEMEVFYEMLEDDSKREREFFDAFIEVCDKYNEHSYEPYDLFCNLLEAEMPFEPYYLEALMHVYCMYEVDDTFLDTLDKVVKTGYCKQYIENTHNQIKEHVKDGFIIAYRGEFATETKGNQEYVSSVSYTLDYEIAKFFATRFKRVMNLTKSVVYTVKVPVEDIVAYIEREEEIVCIPVSRGGRMEVIKEESMI